MVCYGARGDAQGNRDLSVSHQGDVHAENLDLGVRANPLPFAFFHAALPEKVSALLGILCALDPSFHSDVVTLGVEVCRAYPQPCDDLRV